MPDVHVFPHGDRWAVADDLSASPRSEFATCEEAQSAARVLLSERGGGGEVVVSHDDPTGLAAAQDDDAGSGPQRPEAEPSGDGPSGSAPGPDRFRGIQGSL